MQLYSKKFLTYTYYIDREYDNMFKKLAINSFYRLKIKNKKRLSPERQI